MTRSPLGTLAAAAVLATLWHGAPMARAATGAGGKAKATVQRAAASVPQQPSVPATLEAAARADVALAGVYGPRRFAPLWAGEEAAARRRQMFLILLAREQRFAPGGIAVDRLAATGGAPGSRSEIEAEVGLTRAALAYLDRRSGGRPVRPAVAARLIEGMAAIPRDATSMGLALEELRLVNELGGWVPVGMVAPPAPDGEPEALPPATIQAALVVPYTEPGVAQPGIVAPERPRPQPDARALRRRLVQSMDLGAQALAGDGLDAQVAEGVRRFQARQGLAPDGVVGFRTAALINESLADQIPRVALSLARHEAAAPERAGLARYVEVNIPAFELRLVESGKVTFRSRVVVGDEEKATPVFDDWMRYIDLNPSWYVPPSITQEILDKETREPGYMSRAGFVWQTGKAGKAPRLTQRPGPENALGRLKFVFPNHNAVYIHDTPNRGAFNRSDRTLSHGCVRIEEPVKFALAILGAQGWDRPRLEAALAASVTRRVNLDAPLPVFIDYETATLDADGRVQLWQDVYGLDAAGVVRFPAKGLPPRDPPQPAVAPIVPLPPALPLFLPPALVAGPVAPPLPTLPPAPPSLPAPETVAAIDPAAAAVAAGTVPVAQTVAPPPPAGVAAGL